MTHPVVDRRGIRRLDPSGARVRGARTSSRLYGLGVRIEGFLWSAGWKRPRAAPAPVVSVGALTVGGSGKTPFVRWLAERLRERGRAPGILSRGYRSGGGRRPRVVNASRPDAARDGDEPCLLARSLSDVPVVVSPDRVRAADLAVRHGAKTLLLDDGFQHRRLRRDVDIVLWDEGASLSQGRLLPAGFLREPLSALGRADLLVLVDRGTGRPEPPPTAPPPDRVFSARLVCVARQRLDASTRVHALSGIADPASFERSLLDLGLTVTGATRHSDHHAFTVDEIRDASRRAVSEGADVLAVTAKDHVRWPQDPGNRLPVPAVFDLAVEMEAEDRFLGLVENGLARGRR